MQINTFHRIPEAWLQAVPAGEPPACRMSLGVALAVWLPLVETEVDLEPEQRQFHVSPWYLHLVVTLHGRLFAPLHVLSLSGCRNGLPLFLVSSSIEILLS